MCTRRSQGRNIRSELPRRDRERGALVQVARLGCGNRGYHRGGVRRGSAKK